MSRDKQFTEIANDLNMHCCSLAEQFCGEMSCNACISNWLYTAGYRKASDVAREIFEEIEKCRVVGVYGIEGYLIADIAELKKKYTKEITEGEG